MMYKSQFKEIEPKLTRMNGFVVHGHIYVYKSH